jgi:hypothetical protein
VPSVRGRHAGKLAVHRTVRVDMMSNHKRGFRSNQCVVCIVVAYCVVVTVVVVQSSIIMPQPVCPTSRRWEVRGASKVAVASDR